MQLSDYVFLRLPPKQINKKKERKKNKGTTKKWRIAAVDRWNRPSFFSSNFFFTHLQLSPHFQFSFYKIHILSTFSSKYFDANSFWCAVCSRKDFLNISANRQNNSQPKQIVRNELFMSQVAAMSNCRLLSLVLLINIHMDQWQKWQSTDPVELTQHRLCY